MLEVRTQSGDGIAFEPGLVAAPAHARAIIEFTNTSTIDHNLVFLDPIEARTSAIVVPGHSDRLEFETPSVGSYTFVCTIHEGMTGTLRVE